MDANPLPGWRSRLQNIRILGLKPTPEFLAIAMVNFVQGILGLSDLASEYFYKDDLGASEAAPPC